MTRRFRSFAIIASALLCGGCEGWQSALDPHGREALRLLHLVNVYTLTCAAVWAAVMIALVVALGRRGRPDEPGAPLDPRVERGAAIVVSVAIGITVAIIAALTGLSFFATRALTQEAGDPLTLRVTGHQWWWEIAYPDSRPDHAFSTANEIHVPVGREVKIELAAPDVIHSFWAPSLAGKMDLIPGRDNEITFTAKRAGTYRGQCAQFCGLQHAHMAFLVVADQPADFEAWRSAQLQPARSPTSDEEKAGQKVFMSKPCASCHTISGTQASGALGPDLTHVGSRKYIAAGLVETTRGALAAWVADPQTLKPGVNMPLVPLSADELREVSAYLAALK